MTKKGVASTAVAATYGRPMARNVTAEVVGAMRAGERFVISGGNTQAETVLEASVCPVCPAATLRYHSPSTS